MLISYLKQLEDAAHKKGLTLVDCFTVAGVPDSTLYRARNRGGDLRIRVAEKVADVIESGEAERWVRNRIERNKSGGDISSPPLSKNVES